MSKFIATFSFFGRIFLLGMFLTVGLAVTGIDAPPHQLSEKVSVAMPKVQTMMDAKDYDGALALIDSLLPATGPITYDRAILSINKVQALFQKNNHMDAVEPLEASLNLGENYALFDKKACQQFRYYLASLYGEKAMESTKDAATQIASFNKARAYVERWFEVSKDPDVAAANQNDLPKLQYLYATLLFNIAQRDPDHVDLGLIRQALAAVDKGLRMTARPADNLYVLQLAAYQQLGDYLDASAALEHLVKNKPDNKTYWQQLTAFYLNLANIASDKHEDEKVRQYYVRSILTMERAQQHGAMNTPKDNFRLVNIYYNVGQYQQAAELLENGLRSGTIESTPQNWKLLSVAWQQLHKDMKAVEILRDAAKAFPKSGEFDYLAAQILYSLNNTTDALTAIQSCVAKGGGEKPWESWQFLAYLAFELQKFDLAGEAVENAAKYPQAKPSEIQGLRDAVKAALQQREAATQKTK